jgi:hypothetical protein
VRQSHRNTEAHAEFTVHPCPICSGIEIVARNFWVLSPAAISFVWLRDNRDRISNHEKLGENRQSVRTFRTILEVHGLTALRVADVSVMPRIVTGPTNTPTHMVAGSVAKLILS